MMTTRVNDALQFAARKHNGQMRKTDPDVPYFSHVAAVGFILQDAGFAEDVVIAGILHDTVEDTQTRLEEIRDVFGENVADIVRIVSENKSLSWEERKAQYLQAVLEGSENAKAVATADKLNNISGILGHLNRGDVGVWKVFTRDSHQVTMTYRRFVDEVGKIWHSPLLLQLNEMVDELEKKL